MAEQEVQNGGGAEVKAVSFTAVKPQLVVEAPKASDAISFYKAAFGAEELGRTVRTKRKADQEQPLILSAQLLIAGTTILISDSSDGSADAAKAAGSGFVFCLETDDVKAAVAKAVAAGAIVEGVVDESETPSCGGRVSKVKDPYGFIWSICTPAAAEKTITDVAA